MTNAPYHAGNANLAGVVEPAVWNSETILTWSTYRDVRSPSCCSRNRIWVMPSDSRGARDSTPARSRRPPKPSTIVDQVPALTHAQPVPGVGVQIAQVAQVDQGRLPGVVVGQFQVAHLGAHHGLGTSRQRRSPHDNPFVWSTLRAFSSAVKSSEDLQPAFDLQIAVAGDLAVAVDSAGDLCRGQRCASRVRRSGPSRCATGSPSCITTSGLGEGPLQGGTGRRRRRRGRDRSARLTITEPAAGGVGPAQLVEAIDGNRLPIGRQGSNLRSCRRKGDPDVATRPIWQPARGDLRPMRCYPCRKVVEQ